VDLKKKRVLITGAGGFIGSHLCEELVRRNCSVRAFVHYNSFNRWGWLDYLTEDIKSSIDIFVGDIKDPFGTKEAMKNVNVVFHLAALIGIPYSYHSPDVYVDTNIKGTLNVLQAAREFNVERIVHTSTSEIYGTAKFVPITEDHPVNPQSPYAATKAGADFLALTFYKSFGLPVTVVRPFNTYGPRQSARAIIPTIISQILQKQTPLKLGSLHPTRDLNYVIDTVNGFIKAAESDQATGEVLNIGSNKEISMRDLVRKIASLMHTDIQLTEDQSRIRPEKSEVERLWADNSKALKLLNWKPEYSLDTGIRETIKWFSNPENLKIYKSHIYNI